jgi:energy-coupling factor transporter ATP-binding protein EcfA2
LLDEPGANLHAKAQADVLKLINRLGKDTSTVIYSTHSPQMLEYSKLFRVHAVQRSDELDDSPTVVIDAHRLGTASSDTLSPVLTAMGVDLSHQQVIRRDHNVLLEEMSGYYYLTSFWKLTKTKQEVHFIAATGVNKIEALANMFRGWGLDFIVAVDDDKQGREAYKSIKREMFGDDENLSSKKLLKLPDCPGIEDAFSKDDFKKYVLNEPDAKFTETNSEFLKSAGRSKPVLAFQFALAVDEGRVKWADFDKSTQGKMTSIVDALTSRLA